MTALRARGFSAIARDFRLAHRGDTKAFVSKVTVFDKEAG